MSIVKGYLSVCKGYLQIDFDWIGLISFCSFGWFSFFILDWFNNFDWIRLNLNTRNVCQILINRTLTMHGAFQISVCDLLTKVCQMLIDRTLTMQGEDLLTKGWRPMLPPKFDNFLQVCIYIFAPIILLNLTHIY